MQKITKEEILNDLKNIVENEQGFENFKPESTFEDLGMDSLDVVETNMECEKHFHIAIKDGELEVTTSVSQLVDLIYEKLQPVESMK